MSAIEYNEQGPVPLIAEVVGPPPTFVDERGSSSASSQLLSGPGSTFEEGGGEEGGEGRGAGGGGEGGGGGAEAQGRGEGTPDLSVDTSFSNDGSYFILDEGGKHVLDNQGSPARARKWQPANVNQRERYM